MSAGSDPLRLLRETQRKLAEQIRVNADLEEALRAMELRALQAQVNPHFLFNTLSTIAASSFMEEAPKTNELVRALAGLLRYTLRQIGQMVELEEELRHVRDYLLIEKTRFGDRIEVLYDVDPGTLGSRLPLLTLQPIVENAIIHGLESRSDGVIRISAARDDRWVTVEVADNGTGMDEEKAARRDGATHVTGLGLENVRRRLELAFGEDGGLSLESRPGQGTTVRIKFPSAPDGAGHEPAGSASEAEAGSRQPEVVDR